MAFADFVPVPACHRGSAPAHRAFASSLTSGSPRDGSAHHRTVRPAVREFVNLVDPSFVPAIEQETRRRSEGSDRVRHSVDARLFQTAHSPSYFELSRRMGENGRQLIDFSNPDNPYFPTPEMFQQLAGNLENLLRSYPSDADTIAGQHARVL